MADVIDVPRAWSALTPAWFTAALARHCPVAVVSEAEVGPVADGTNRRASVRLCYAAGTGPERVFVKMHGRMLERQFRASAALAAAGPQTVLHGDPHPGNTYALPGDRTGFYDWQLIRTGNWSHDVGYFLAGSLSVADRREHERELLGGYLGALREAGADPPPLDHAWQRYRASPA